MTTNNAPASNSASDDLRTEYVLDYAKSRPNRFTPRKGDTVVAVAIRTVERDASWGKAT